MAGSGRQLEHLSATNTGQGSIGLGFFRGNSRDLPSDDQMLLHLTEFE